MKNCVIGQMNTVLNPSPDDSDTEILIVENSETVEMTKLQVNWTYYFVI